MLALALALAAAAADTLAPAAAQEGPAVVVHRQPALPVVAVRLSVLADDPPGHAGAGHLLQHLHLPRLEEQAARVGGRVQAVRSADAVVYTAVGPAAELDYLAGLLRSALRPPTPSPAEMLSALRALADERGAEREIAPSYVRAALRAALFPGDVPAAGTGLSAQRLEAASLPALWGEMYRPERVAVVAVGDVELEGVRRAFAELPPAGGGGLAELPADTLPPLAADTPQATRAWIGAAYPTEGAGPAALTVAARLLRNRMQSRMTRSQVAVEHWWTHHGQALAIVVATPDSLAATARRTVEGALAALSGALAEDAVRDAAAAVRRDMLFFSRTPERMAEVLGTFADRGEGEDAAQRFFEALEEVTLAEVRGVLDLLAAQEPVQVFVAAQRLVAR
ncbi:MAG TPA: hypothetical protein VFX98_09495 [Longimicrobiaceae bacterium]|nr:hypothetical protein [Longimicrobiaceae bacterium]